MLACTPCFVLHKAYLEHIIICYWDTYQSKPGQLLFLVAPAAAQSERSPATYRATYVLVWLHVPWLRHVCVFLSLRSTAEPQSSHVHFRRVAAWIHSNFGQQLSDLVLPLPRLLTSLSLHLLSKSLQDEDWIGKRVERFKCCVNHAWKWLLLQRYWFGLSNTAGFRGFEVIQSTRLGTLFHIFLSHHTAKWLRAFCSLLSTFLTRKALSNDKNKATVCMVVDEDA